MKNVFSSSVVFALILAVFSLVGADVPVSCPEDFDPDDRAWFIVVLGDSTENPHPVRRFLYEPDPVRRLTRSVPINKCVGIVHSYHTKPYGHEKRVRMSLHAPSASAFYLMTENGEWKRGYRIEEHGEFSQTEGDVLQFILYDRDEKIVLAERKIFLWPLKKSNP